jgi:hypothetical protein
MISSTKCQTCAHSDWGKPSEPCEQCIGFSKWQKLSSAGIELANFECQYCGFTTQKPRKCPTTGMEHGTGFVYICEVCHANLSLEIRSCQNCSKSLNGSPDVRTDTRTDDCWDCSRLGNWSPKKED